MPGDDQDPIDISVTGGMVASYGKLNNVRVKVLTSEPEQVTVAAETDWVTSLSTYHTTQHLTLMLRSGQWYIEPDPVDITVPPEEFFGVVRLAGSRPAAAPPPGLRRDILDRPELQVISARLVKHAGRYSVVGELINTDSDPADVTVTAFLDDAEGAELSHYNAQEAMMHKLLPKEVTPFRVDFEGVAGRGFRCTYLMLPSSSRMHLRHRTWNARSIALMPMPRAWSPSTILTCD